MRGGVLSESSRKSEVQKSTGVEPVFKVCGGVVVIVRRECVGFRRSKLMICDIG